MNRSRLLFAFLFLSLSHLALEGSFFPVQVEGFRWFWLAISSILGLVVGDTLLFKAYVLIGCALQAAYVNCADYQHAVWLAAVWQDGERVGVDGRFPHGRRCGLCGNGEAGGANGRCFCGRDAVILAAILMKTLKRET